MVAMRDLYIIECKILEVLKAVKHIERCICSLPSDLKDSQPMEGWAKECLSDKPIHVDWRMNDREYGTCQTHLEKSPTFSIIYFKGLELRNIQAYKAPGFNRHQVN